MLSNPDLADTYRLIARRGPDAFYGGALAREIASTVRTPPVRPGATRDVRPGSMTADDLADYTIRWRPPVSVRYRGYDVYGMPSSSSGGTTVGEALNIMEALRPPAPTRPAPSTAISRRRGWRTPTAAPTWRPDVRRRPASAACSRSSSPPTAKRELIGPAAPSGTVAAAAAPR